MPRHATHKGWDVTSIFDHYRDICRVVWNHGFYSVEDLNQGFSVILFDQVIQKSLFEGLVLNRFSELSEFAADNPARPGEPIWPFRVVGHGDPKSVAVDLGGGNFSFEPVDIKALDLVLLDVCDYGNTRHREFSYYRALVSDAPSESRYLVGKAAMVEVTSAQILTDAAPDSPDAFDFVTHRRPQ